MKKYQFNKLIRSKLPERMGREGVKLVGRHLNDKEFAEKLKSKLVEEALEVQDADNTESLIKELADVMEVIDSIASLHNITIEEIKREQEIKRDTNGHFLPANFVDYIEVPTDKHEVIEYLENRNRPYEYTR